MHHTQTFGYATLALANVTFGRATKLLTEAVSLPPFQDDGSASESGYTIVNTLALFSPSDVCLNLVRVCAFGHKCEDEATGWQVVGRDMVEKCLKPLSVSRSLATYTVRFRTQLIPIGRVAEYLWTDSA